MNAKAKFHLNVRSSNAGHVWPMEARNDKDLDDRLQDSFYADEDEAAASFELRDMEDLVKLIKFYDGRPVILAVHAQVETDQFVSYAGLSRGWDGGPSASVQSLEKDDISPSTASSRLQAIAFALEKWERSNQVKP